MRLMLVGVVLRLFGRGTRARATAGEADGVLRDVDRVGSLSQLAGRARFPHTSAECLCLCLCAFACAFKATCARVARAPSAGLSRPGQLFVAVARRAAQTAPRAPCQSL